MTSGYLLFPSRQGEHANKSMIKSENDSGNDVPRSSLAIDQTIQRVCLIFVCVIVPLLHRPLKFDSLADGQTCTILKLE